MKRLLLQLGFFLVVFSMICPAMILAEMTESTPQLTVTVKSASNPEIISGAEVEMEDAQDPDSAVMSTYNTDSQGIVTFQPKDFEGFTIKKLVAGETKTIRYNGEKLSSPGSFKVRLRIQAPERIEQIFDVDVPANEQVSFVANID